MNKTNANKTIIIVTCIFNRNRTVQNKVAQTTKPNLVDYFQLQHAKRLAVQDKHANFEELLTRTEDYIANSAVLTTASSNYETHKLKKKK